MRHRTEGPEGIASAMSRTAWRSAGRCVVPFREWVQIERWMTHDADRSVSMSLSGSFGIRASWSVSASTSVRFWTKHFGTQLRANPVESCYNLMVAEDSHIGTQEDTVMPLKALRCAP